MLGRRWAAAGPPWPPPRRHLCQVFFDLSSICLPRRPPAVTGDHLHLHLMAALRLIITACGDGVSLRRPSVDCLSRKATLLQRSTCDLEVEKH